MMKIKPFGESAIWIQLGQDISPITHAKVMALQSRLAPQLGKGITYFIPAYHSLTIGFDTQKINQKDLIQEISGGFSTIIDISTNEKSRILRIPTCYDDSFSLDMDEISSLLDISKEDIVDLHTHQVYDVYMLGFLPGFPYMGITNEQLDISRKKSPRIKIPAGSVGLAGRQTGIYPSEAPGGWQIIGRTPIPIFDPKREDPFLLQTGDQVSFLPIGLEEYQEIREKVNNDEYFINALIEDHA